MKMTVFLYVVLFHRCLMPPPSVPDCPGDGGSEHI
jgi:hypothetical protein